MRNAPNVKLERWRWGGPPRTNYGYFLVPGPNKVDLRVVLGCGYGWDHASVSTEYRTPTWEEMSFIKGLCFRDDEVVMELHPAKANYINEHPHCLHLWRPQTAKEMADEYRAFVEWGEPVDDYPWIQPDQIPLPPGWMVGKELADAYVAKKAGLSTSSEKLPRPATEHDLTTSEAPSKSTHDHHDQDDDQD